MTRFQHSVAALAASPCVAIATTLFISIVLPFGGRAHAQGVLLDLKSPTVGDFAGNATMVGDWDGDGIADVAIGAHLDATVASNAGSARVQSGRNGNTIVQWFGQNVDDYFGYELFRVRDLNGDGIDELAVPSPWFDASGTDTGSLFVYSGGGGALLWRVDGPAGDSGFSYLSGVLGDVDGDGVADLFARSGNPSQTTIHVLSGVDGHQITSVGGDPAKGFCGWITSIDDVDGDGVRELLISIEDPNATPLLAGEVDVISPVTGAILRSHVGTYQLERLGFQTTQLGDLDGDGVHEYAILAKHDPRGGSAVVYVHSGASGAQLARIGRGGVAHKYFNPWIENVGDVNGDGFEDFGVYGSWSDAQLTAGALYFFSGRTFLELGWIFLDEYLLASFDGAGDFDGDGRADVLFGTTDLALTGRVRIFAGDDLWLTAVPPIPVAGDTLALTTREGTPGALSVVTLQAFDGVPLFTIVGGVGSFDATGGFETDVVVPSGLAGHSATFQTFANDANGHVIASFTRQVDFR
jgi:hypothetical protein